jgi:hypothetical protein
MGWDVICFGPYGGLAGYISVLSSSHKGKRQKTEKNRQYFRNTNRGLEGDLPPGYWDLLLRFPPVIAHVTRLISPAATGCDINLADYSWHLFFHFKYAVLLIAQCYLCFIYCWKCCIIQLHHDSFFSTCVLSIWHILANKKSVPLFNSKATRFSLHVLLHARLQTLNTSTRQRLRQKERRRHAERLQLRLKTLKD